MDAQSRKRLDNIIQTVLGVTKVTDELSMESVPRWDSLRHIQLLSEIEESFGIEIGFKDTLKMTTVGAIHEIVGTYLHEK